MKKPEEYIKDSYNNNFGLAMEDDELLTEVKIAIKQAQKDAYNFAIEKAAEEAEVRIKYYARPGEPDGYSDDKIWIRDQDGTACDLFVDKQSILKLKID